MRVIQQIDAIQVNIVGPVQSPSDLNSHERTAE